MTQNTYNWDAFEKRLRKTRLISLVYVVPGIILLILTSPYLQMNMLIMSVIYSICFGSLLGYICRRYQIAMYKREIGSWQALASSNILGIFVGTFRGIKWYSWLFYSFLGLLFIAGIIMQVFIFRPPRATRFIFMFAGALQIIGSLSFFASFTSQKIILMIRSAQKERTNGMDQL